MIKALVTIKNLLIKWGTSTAGFSRIQAKDPKRPTTEVYGHIPHDGKPFDSKLIIECLVDAESWKEYKATYGKTILCGYARIDGWAVGIVANNRKVTKNAKGEMQFGGVIYSDSADKAARFVANCNQKKVP